MKQTSISRRQLMLAGLAGIASQLELGQAHAQDAAKVMPRAFRVAFENDKMRVLEFTGRPGMGICGEGMHSHPARLTIAMSDWQARATDPDGTARNLERKMGDVSWREAETHKVENAGKTNSRLLIVELKTTDKGKA